MRTPSTQPPAPGRQPTADRAAPRIHLTVTAGPHAGRTFTLVGHDTFLVGRSKRAHFRLPAKDKYFSRVHFMVEVNPPQCRLTDMGSRNGTRVNGLKVATADLKDGDIIEAGHTTMRLRVEAACEQPTVGPEREVTVATIVPTAARPAPEPSPSVCRVCAGALGPAGSTDVPRICPACREQIRRQPQPIPDYHLVRELGRGGMGIVYLAVAATGRAVALKAITPAVAGSRGHVDRFLREARILQQLDHPNIVAFRAMGEAGGQLYFAMDFVRGIDGERLVKGQGPLAVGRAVGLVCQLLQALEYAQAKGFVHRDIKPANLLIVTEGGRETVKLADFGLARVYQASELSGLTLKGEMGGTIAYMAPEQISSFREAKPEVDQYAAAATLYNLLTGHLIFDLPRNTADRILMILQDEPVAIRQRRANLPEPLAAIIHRALAREPHERFAHVRDLRKALLPYAG
jgi:serine/threonine-protein kinase